METCGAARNRNDAATRLMAGGNRAVSLLLFGALVAHAPQFSAHLGGLQNSDVTPFS